MAAIPERLAGIEARERDRDRRLDGLHRTLYGDAGNGGLQADVKEVMSGHRQHVKATDEALERTTKVLVGFKGDNGLIGDVAILKKEAERRQFWFRAVMAAAISEGFVLFVILLKWLLERAP